MVRKKVSYLLGCDVVFVEKILIDCLLIVNWVNNCVLDLNFNLVCLVEFKNGI